MNTILVYAADFHKIYQAAERWLTEHQHDPKAQEVKDALDMLAEADMTAKKEPV